MNILVSIICITYNHEDYISTAIEGFLMQRTNFEFEILIGDDYSKDNTQQIIKSYINRFPDKIKLITSGKNIGARNNLKRTWEEAKGKYIAICEGDDYWTDEYKLQKQIDYMEANLECSLCCHNVEIYNETLKKKVGIFKECIDKKFFVKDVIINGGGFLPSASLVYRKEIIDNLPEWYMNVSVGDYPLQMIASTYGYVYFMKDIMAVYRLNVPGSWTNSNYYSKKSKDKEIKYRKGIIEILDRFNEYSNGDFFYEISEVKIPLQFEIEILSGNLKRITKSKYKSYYEKLEFREKVKTRIKMVSPDYFIKISNFIFMIKGSFRSFFINKL